MIPADWMPNARMERIIVHWTAGVSKASALDRSHYHILVEDDGELVRGTLPISANAPGASGPRASHTLNCNTGSIGLSLCGMRGAVPEPFDPGPSPLTRPQWDAAMRALAQLCQRYGIVPGPRTLLSHAEVSSNLGIAQRGKWDIARLPFEPTIIGAGNVGALMRTTVRNLMS